MLIPNPDSMDKLGPCRHNVVNRRRLRGSNVGNPHWPNVILLIGSAWSPHVDSTSGPHESQNILAAQHLLERCQMCSIAQSTPPHIVCVYFFFFFFFFE